MKSSDEKFLPGIKDGQLSLTLSKIETEALLDVLAFAHSGALAIVKEEAKTGATTHAKRMLDIAADAKELTKIILSFLQVGRPESPEDIN